MTTRRHFSLQLACAATLGAVSPLGYAQQSTARITIGFPAGSTFDAFARRIADRLRGSLAPAVIVENKAGAGGLIAITAAKDGAADGTQILLAPSAPFTVYPHTYKNLPYKNEDFRPIATSLILEPALGVGLVVPESVKTFKDFISWCEANPKLASYATPGTGSMLHMIGAYIGKYSKIDWQNVSYRGSPPMIQDLLGGQIAAGILPLSEFINHTKEGKLRVLAISSKERSKFLPNVPTLRESGVPITAREWYGFYLPASTSPATARRVAAYLQVVLNNPEMIAWANSMSLQMQFKGLDDTENQIKTELEEWRPIIKSIGFTTES